MPKSILITGCSSGIGLRAAEMLHARGYRVFATARKAENVAALKEKGLESLILDVDNSESIKTAVDEVLSRTGGTLDALFNNSGMGVPGAVEDLTRDMMRTQFETNVFGAMELTNLIIPVMRKQCHGRIIQNTSMLGIIAYPYYGAYAASKFALEGFSNSLRMELRGTNIFVSIIVPGPIKSYFRKNALKSYENTLENKPCIHSETYKTLKKVYLNAPSKGEQMVTLEPDAVVKKLIHALESSKPRSHYYITWPSIVFCFLHRIFPDSWLDKIIMLSARAEKSKE